jgi:hypothetical protein
MLRPVILALRRVSLRSGWPQTACMRKLLTILNAMMRTNVAWRDIHESPSTELA